MPRERQRPADRQATLDQAKKEQMLAILVRNRDAFEQVCDVLGVKHVREMSDGHALVWKLTREFFERYQELPRKANLLAELNNALEANRDLLDDDERDEVDDFVDYIYDVKEHGKGVAKSKTHAELAVDTCRQYLKECVASALQDELLREGTVPAALADVIQERQAELDVVESLGDVQLGLPFPEGWDTRERSQLLTTGITILDDFTGGGLADGETLLFMGPYGSCKTTLTCHAAAECVRKARMVHRAGKGRDGKKPMVVLIFTEGTKAEYRQRLLSHMATVLWRRLGQMESVEALSKSARPGGSAETHYETAEFAKQKRDGFKSEYRRVNGAVKICNEHLLMIDCTDSNTEGRKLGLGGVPELAGIIRGYFRKNEDQYPMIVYLDHLSALATRVITAKYGGDFNEHLRHVLRTMPLQLQDKITNPFKTRLLMMHQLSGEANTRGPTAKFHHADSAESKAVPEFVPFAVVTGPTDGDGVCKFECTKHRREPASPYKIVRVQGQFNRLRDETELFFLDPARREFVLKVDLEARHAANKHGARIVDDNVTLE